jgi:hypothetical protein
MKLKVTLILTALSYLLLSHAVLANSFEKKEINIIGEATYLNSFTFSPVHDFIANTEAKLNAQIEAFQEAVNKAYVACPLPTNINKKSNFTDNAVLDKFIFQRKVTITLTVICLE